MDCRQLTVKAWHVLMPSFFTQEVALSYLHDGAHPLLAMYDLEKAYDSVEHFVLLEKLLEVGVGGRTWRIIADWYSSAKSGVCVSLACSWSFSISRGVHQGSVLSSHLS